MSQATAKTVEDLIKRADQAITGKESTVFDTAARHNVSVPSVLHEGWFHTEVMMTLTKLPAFSHLKEQIYA